MSVKEISLPWPSEPLRSNTRAPRLHTATEAKKHRGWARVACLEAPRIERIPNATIFVEYYPPTKRGDIHNVPSSLKAYIDGIADAMGCDDKGFTVDYPPVWAGSGKPGKVVFRIVRPADPRGPVTMTEV